MKVLDPGHSYEVEVYDGLLEGLTHDIHFMKREGTEYPGNKGTQAGTNCQELMRVLIDRLEYLDHQNPHPNNGAAIQALKFCIFMMEERAAQRHGIIDRLDMSYKQIHKLVTCKICGHVVCRHPDSGILPAADGLKHIPVKSKV